MLANASEMVTCAFWVEGLVFLRCNENQSVLKRSQAVPSELTVAVIIKVYGVGPLTLVQYDAQALNFQVGKSWIPDYKGLEAGLSRCSTGAGRNKTSCAGEVTQLQTSAARTLRPLSEGC